MIQFSSVSFLFIDSTADFNGSVGISVIELLACDSQIPYILTM